MWAPVDYFCALRRHFRRNCGRRRAIFTMIRRTVETRAAEMALTIFPSRIFLCGTVPGAVATPAPCGEGVSIGAGVATAPGTVPMTPVQSAPARGGFQP